MLVIDLSKTGIQKASFYFGLEEYLLNNDFGDSNIFVIWKCKPTVMVGKHQNTLEEIDFSYVKDNNIDIVRRKSGGGAIFTDEGTVQFTFITKDSDTNTISFKDFVDPIVDFLKQFNIDSNNNTRNDVVINLSDGIQRKVSGNAQYIRNKNVLHHGSILINTNIDKLSKSLTPRKSKLTSKGIKSVKERVLNILDLIDNKEYNTDLFMKDLERKIAEHHCATYYEITENDLVQIKNYEEEFLSWDWNFGKSPNFKYKNIVENSNGKIIAYINVESGKISDIVLEGDYFSNLDFERLLIGTEYELEAIKEKIESIKKENSIEEIIYNFNDDDLLKLLFEL